MQSPRPSPETIANVRVLLFSCIFDYSDAETQQLKWLSLTETNPHYTYVECICSYFDDSLVGKSLEQLQLDDIISDEELVAIKPFHILADAYKPPIDDYDHGSILKDSKWHIIQTEAQRTCEKLLSIVSLSREKDALRS